METKPKSTKMLAILVLALALMVCPKKTTAGVGDIKQLIHDFVVASGESVTAGDVVSSFEGGIQKGFGVYGSEYVFNQHGTWNISVAALSSTKFVVAYTQNRTATWNHKS
jgi:hypothetical protein